MAVLYSAAWRVAAGTECEAGSLGLRWLYVLGSCDLVVCVEVPLKYKANVGSEEI